MALDGHHNPTGPHGVPLEHDRIAGPGSPPPPATRRSPSATVAEYAVREDRRLKHQGAPRPPIDCQGTTPCVCVAAATVFRCMPYVIDVPWLQLPGVVRLDDSAFGKYTNRIVTRIQAVSIVTMN
jgi:hypothetical protein